MREKDKYLLKDDGTPYRTADGKSMRLEDFDNDPMDVEEGSQEEVDKDIRELDLGELLNEVIAEEKQDKKR